MGSRTIREQGFPLGQIKGTDYFYFPGIEGGKGGGAPSIPLANSRYLYWPVKINPFSVKNKKFVLLNTDFKSYDGPSTTVVADEIVPGPSLDFDVLLAYHAPTSDSVATAGVTGTVSIPGAATWPMEIVFNEDNIPQPIIVGYERRVWVIIDLRAIGRFIGVDVSATTQRIDMQVINFEERI